MDKRQKGHHGLESVILSSATRYMLPLLLLFSIFILLRGHNEPGGGFVGGLVAASGFSLFAIAQGVDKARSALRRSPLELIAFGLTLAVGSGLFGRAVGVGFMAPVWSSFELPGIGKLGTPLFFDIGVYCVVLGVVVNIVFTFFEDQREAT